MASFNPASCSPFSRAVVSSMQKLYPESLADKSFDNTGLLLEAPFDFARRQKNSVLLTIDLTKAVADEAIERGDSIIIAYHPIIFRGLKSLTLGNTQQQSLLRLAQHGISVYSPHTAVDAVPGGMADWLCDIITEPLPHSRSTIHPNPAPPPGFQNAGAGRLVTLAAPSRLFHLIKRLSVDIHPIKGFSLALPQGKAIEDMAEIRTIATCPGSGSSILLQNGNPAADLLLTGEMSHHDALAATERGSVVISLFHTNSERGFLHDVMSEKLEETLQSEWDAVRREETIRLGRGDKDIGQWLDEPEFTVSVSERDRDPTTDLAESSPFQPSSNDTTTLHPPPSPPSPSFTTPPQTRKRRACEAVDDEVDTSSPRSATGAGAQLDIAAVQKKVRRALEDSGDPPSPHLLQKRVVDLAAPAAIETTTTSTSTTMDSDDEFLTDGSSQGDMLDMQGSEDESLAEDFGDDDFGGSFSYDKDMIKQSRKPYEVDFKVLSTEDIQREQNVQIQEVSSILGLPPESAAILLRYGRWNREKLIESYMERPDEIQEEAGVGSSFSGTPKTEVIPGFTCDICCDDDDDLETYAMRCGHRFCVDCYRHYLGQKIREEGEAARIQCPQHDCHRIVDSKTLDFLVTEDLRERYHILLMRTYVDDKENLKWCPAPNCEFAVDCPVKKRELNRIVPTVQCSCTHSFCFGCTLNDHQPPPCTLVKKWLKKCKDDSETANWISANTKECPKCASTIEKNGGCNHMTCRKCKHEFCWMCMGPWSEHGTSWYNCNRFEEKSGTTARDAQARSRQSLERYLHYYNRYANHEQSAKLDKDLYLKTEKKMMSLQSQSGMSWIEVQFLDTASHALQQCRQTLKWTYAFAFYLARNNLTEIFEDNQKDLEMAVESLSEMFEKPIDQLSDLKVDILDKTAYCNKRRVILLSDTAEALKNGMLPLYIYSQFRF
ncbi:hypothetical protein FQN55_005688 [Onygenales sp. PD_40]|nr:hypothetical protein FQN55_005688 [Onygenales sp. PD_40]